MRQSVMLFAVGLLFAASAAMADEQKAAVCHNDQETGEYLVINISPKAIPAHIANHGDWLVTEERCGDALDNDCDGEVDEDCVACPCLEEVSFSDVEIDLGDEYEDASDCYLYDNNIDVFMERSNLSGDTYWFAAGGAHEEPPGTFTCHFEYLNSEALEGSFYYEITALQYVECEAQLIAAAAAYGVACEETTP